MSNLGENTGAHVTHTSAGEYGSDGKTGTGAYGTKNSSECETGNKGHGQGTKNGSECETGNKGHGQDYGSKLPGGNKPTTTGQDAYGHAAATTPREGYGAHGTEAEKKGIVEKIKEKLPGGHPQQ